MAKVTNDVSELRVLIADDHELLLRGVRALLETQPGWKVIAEARDGHEAVKKALDLEPDIAILGISMSRLNGLDAARRITKMLPETKVLVLTQHESEQLAREALKTGARGYISKSDPADDLILAVQALARGKTFFSSRLHRLVMKNFLQKVAGEDGNRQNGEQLTSRQREIVQLLAEGKSSKEISVVLNLSIKTVETHRAHIMARLGCHCICDLVRYAIRNNIVTA